MRKQPKRKPNAGSKIKLKDCRKPRGGLTSIVIFALILLISLALLLFQAHMLNIDQLSNFLAIVEGRKVLSPQVSVNKTALKVASNQVLRSTFLARLPRQEDRLRVAFAITMTMDGNFLDGAAIFAYSIAEASRGKDYDWSLVAFVHPNVTSSRLGLTKLGFHVIEAPIPIKLVVAHYSFYLSGVDFDYILLQCLSDRI